MDLNFNQGNSMSKDDYSPHSTNYGITKLIRQAWRDLKPEHEVQKIKGEKGPSLDQAIKDAIKSSSPPPQDVAIRRAAVNIRDFDVMRLIRILRNRYIAKKEAHGSRLPTETEILALAEKKGLSLQLSGVRRALSYLKDTQEISSQRGKGNTVRNSFKNELKLYKKLLPLSEQVKISEMEIVSHTIEAAKDWINSLLKIQTNRKILKLNILRKVELGSDIHSISMSNHFIKLKGLNAEEFISVLQKEKSFTKTFERFNIAWERKTTGVSTRLPTEKEAEALGIGIFDPVLVMTGVNVSQNLPADAKMETRIINSADIPAGEVIEVTETILPGHRWNLIFDFKDIY